MGVFSRAFSKRSWSPSDDRWYFPIGHKTGAGVRVSEQTALQYTTIAACCQLIAGDIAKLPLLVCKREDKTVERLPNHRLYDLLKTAPNPELTSFNWRESSLLHLLLWGNTYHQIIRNQTNQIVGFWPIYPQGVEPFRKKDGMLWYKWKNDAGEDVERPKKDILHIPGFGFNGLVGISVIGLIRESVGLGLAQEEFASTYFGNGTHPAGALEMDGVLGDAKTEFVKSFREQYSGLGTAHSVVVLEHGLKYKPLTLSLKDSQFIEGQQFTQTQICGFYRDPPHKIAIHGANSNYNNLEQENQHYVDSCLSHWVRRWESCLNLQLLTAEERKSGTYIMMEMKGLLRGDTEARGNFYQMLLNNGVPINRILALEDMNPVKGGDQGLVQLNMIPLEDLGDIQSQKIGQGISEEIKSHIYRKRAKGGIIVRDRIVKQYYPLFKQAATDIVTKEVNAIKRKLGQRADVNIKGWLEDFYLTMPDYIKKKFGPTFMSFAEAIRSASGDEIGVTPDNIDKFVNDYIDAYAKRHAGGSEGQLVALENEEAIGERVDEWSEKRPDKIATNETVRMSNAVFQMVAFGVGLGTVWRTRGAKTCPYCKEFEGRRVVSGGSFIGDGDEVKPSGQQPMKIRGMKAHPPLHAGCDCYLSAG